ncbi:gliding motility-associated C-terminal domain-containing protein [Flavobacterium enshiense]|uniref:gliding motility-associated C-terminal domain-containing protein n=1 Tax=Flavobacterium enshiense TaxID=1341165 RepID=UPI00345DB46F
MKRALIFFFFFLVSNFSFGQLSNFTLQVTATNETCSGNGVLTFTVTNTTPGATIIYNVYRLPDVTTPITVTSANSFTGLVAGNYRVVATQSLGALSNSQQQDAVIVNAIVPLEFNLDVKNVLCGNDGEITVNVTQGSAVNYEIISGPMTFPLQTSNRFVGLTTGSYQVRVFDSCGNGVVRDVTITRPSIPNLIIGGYMPNEFTCNSIDMLIGISSGTTDLQNIIAYPLNVETTVFPPSGAPIVSNLTVNAGHLTQQQLTVPIAFFPDQSYTFNLKITDACGTVYQLNNNTVNIVLNLELQEGVFFCGQKLLVNPINYVAPYTVTFVSAPPGFNPLQFNSSHPGPFTEPTEYGNAAIAYPEGDYVVQITDACGRTITKSYTTRPLPLEFTIQEYMEDCVKKFSIETASESPFTVEFLSAPAGFNPVQFNPAHPGPFVLQAEYFNITVPYPDGTYVIRITDVCGRTATEEYTTIPLGNSLMVFTLPGCADGEGSVFLRNGEGFQNVYIETAPSGFGQTLPYDVSHNIKSDIDFFSMNSLPAGTYTLRYVNTCNQSKVETITIPGYQITSNQVVVTEHCSSFDVQLNFASNSSSGDFWLQKYFPQNNSWGHPQTGYSDNFPLSPANALPMINNMVNTNFNYLGRFRIVTTFSVFTNGENADGTCQRVLHEFEFTSGPEISNVYSYSCSNSLVDVIVDAVGAAPLQYRITLKNGQPFVVNNGGSALFSSLDAGVYNFQIEDSCGNIFNRIYDISTPVSFAISSSNLCDGQTGSLSVPYFSFLSYEWWKDNNTATILSTTNVLTFPSFNSAANFGTYHVRIFNSSNPNSCMNTVMDFVISNELNNPVAGSDNNVVLCGGQNVINLFDYLTGPYDANGVWEEISSSGTLTNNFWDTTSIAAGTYTFKYRVDGLCSVFDEAFVQIEIGEIPEAPVASGDTIVCEGETLHLFASDIAGVTYQWTGPNGFVSNEQNPEIPNMGAGNQGVYSVSVLQDGCESGASTVEVVMESLPYFSVKNACENSLTYLSVELLNPAIDLDSMEYTWTYPDGTTVTNTNPINVTGNVTGSYILTMTSPNGCTVTNSIDVACTHCGIPRGVSANNDGLNDTFDLSCLTGIVNAKIFNRYGVTVYEKDNYIDEWDGKDFNGRLLPPATYYYVVKFASGDVKTGWVYLNH